MSDLITKNDVRDGLKATIQKILETHANIAKNEAKEQRGFAKLAKAGDPTNNPAFTGAGSDVSDNNMGAAQMSLGFDKAALNPVVKRAMKKGELYAPAGGHIKDPSGKVTHRDLRYPNSNHGEVMDVGSAKRIANYSHQKDGTTSWHRPTIMSNSNWNRTDGASVPGHVKAHVESLNPYVKKNELVKSLVPAPAHTCPNCKGEVVIVGRSGSIEHGLCKGCGESPHRTIQEENVAAQQSSGLNTDSQMPAGQTVQDANKSALPKEELGKAELSKVTPPGEEKLVHKLKDEYGHDKAGKEKAYATAWSIHNKMTKTALPAVVRNAMKKDETDSHIKVRQDTVVEKPMPGAEMPPKNPKNPEKNGNGRTDSDNNGIIKGKLNKGAISDAVDKAREKAHVSKDKNLKDIGFPGVPKELNKKSIAAVEAEKAKEKAEREAQNPARKIPRNFAEKQKEKQKESGQVQKAEGIPAAPTAPKSAGNKIPKIAPPVATKPITTIPPQQSKL